VHAALFKLQNLQLLICSVTVAVADRTSCCFVVIGITSPRSVSSARAQRPAACRPGPWRERRLRMLQSLTDPMSSIVPARGPKPDSPRIGCNCGSLLAITMRDVLRSVAQWMLCVGRALGGSVVCACCVSWIAEPPPSRLHSRHHRCCQMLRRALPCKFLFPATCTMTYTLAQQMECSISIARHLCIVTLRSFVAYMAPPAKHPALAQTSKFGLASARHPHSLPLEASSGISLFA